jgi:lipoprotein-releasing system ATP-binding protein
MNERGGRGPVLEAEGLRRDFVTGETTLEVLRGIGLEVVGGEILAVVGPSGSGKSTLLHCLGGLDRPTAGTVRVRGTDLATLRDADLARMRNREIGFVFQFHHLLPDFTARENVMLPRLIAGDSAAEADRRATALLEEVGLGERLEHAPGELSGGEQQRVAVARALVNDPAVVLADEPSGNLDRASSRSLHGLLEELRARRGAAFVLATHDPELARRADRVVAMRDGRLVVVDGGDPATWVAGNGGNGS